MRYAEESRPGLTRLVHLRNALYLSLSLSLSHTHTHTFSLSLSSSASPLSSDLHIRSIIHTDSSLDSVFALRLSLSYSPYKRQHTSPPNPPRPAAARTCGTPAARIRSTIRRDAAASSCRSHSQTVTTGQGNIRQSDAVNTGRNHTVTTGQIDNLTTGQIDAVTTGQVDAVATGQRSGCQSMYTKLVSTAHGRPTQRLLVKDPVDTATTGQSALDQLPTSAA